MEAKYRGAVNRVEVTNELNERFSVQIRVCLWVFNLIPFITVQWALMEEFTLATPGNFGVKVEG